MLPSLGPSSLDLMKKVEDLLKSTAKKSRSCNKEVQNTNELTEESAEEGGLVSNQHKASKVKMKQPDIRKLLSGASSRFTQDDSESEPREKKSVKGRKKRSISTSPKDQNKSKKGDQDDEESGSATEYESPNSSGSESSGSYDPPSECNLKMTDMSLALVML